MSRSTKKGPFVDEKLFKKVNELNEPAPSSRSGPGPAPARSSRSSSGHTFEVHNGNKFKVFVQEDMVGHKLGEFSPTRTFRGHTWQEGRRRPARPK